MAEINCARWTLVYTCMYLEHSRKIKRWPLHGNSCTRDNMAKSWHSYEDLTTMT